MNKKILESGLRVHRSKQGARGFFYPDLNDSLLVRKSCSAEAQVGWHHRDGCVAYIVPADAFSVDDRYEVSPSRMVVWIPTDDKRP